ncbi:MAG: FitA-like ribbon-helix-helix domain-containing protein [Myxococcaceae bacterium]
MSTLNIKDFPESLHRKLKARAKRNHRSTAQEVTHLLKEILEGPRSSILELRGLGKERWRDVVAERHVDDERAAWD